MIWRQKIYNMISLPHCLYHRLRDFYRNQRIFNKIVSLDIMLLGALCLIGIIGTQITTQIYDDQLYQRTTQVMNQLSTGIENDLQNIESFSISAALDPEIQEQLSKAKNSLNFYEQMEGVNKLKDKLLIESLSQKSYLSSISFVDTKGMMFTLGDNPAEIDNTGTIKLIRKAVAASGKYVFDESNLPSNEFQSAREIVQYNDLSLQPLGTLLFRCNLDEIVQANYNKVNSDQASLYIYSEDKLIYSEKGAPPKVSVPRDKKQGYSICDKNNEKFFIAYTVSDYMGWTYVSLIPYQSIFKGNNTLRSAMLLSFLLMFGFSVYIAYRISRNITRPLENLTSSMKQAETGNFQNFKSELSDYKRSDEVGVLQRDFILMIRRIDELIRENYKKQLVIKDTEYRALQSQIEPHFLYNTFSSINWLAKTGRNKDVSMLIMSLSELLRASISKKPVIFLEEEIKLLTCYINIQKVRYDDRADFIINIDSRHLQYVVPRMILQPLVENSIKYGVENMLGICQIRVYSEDGGNSFTLIVEDNGPGMSLDFVEKLNRFEVEPTGTGIGIKNISDRIKNLYGDGYGLKAASGGGVTRVAITIPKRGE